MILVFIFITLVLTYILLVVGSILYFKEGKFKSFYHDILRWHKPSNDLYEFDGESIHSVCKHCGKEIMQDSQGNWF